MADDGSDFGLGLAPGAHHYRAFVGPPEDYDVVAGQQFSLLFWLGLRETHTVADVGCGSLRAGRLLIPYLRPGRYCGIEPEEWAVREGLARELGPGVEAVKQPRFRFVDDFSLDGFGETFDFVLAQSIFTHTYADLAQRAFHRVADSLARTGLFVATFVEDPASPHLDACRLPGSGSGWEYPACVKYRWDEVEELLGSAGMVGRRLDWPTPRVTWFAAGRADAADVVAERAAGLRSPVAVGNGDAAASDPGAARAEAAALRQALDDVYASETWRVGAAVLRGPRWIRHSVLPRLRRER